MMRVPPKNGKKDISEVFGMLERQGRPPVTIEEMTEAVISKAVEDQRRSTAARSSRPEPQELSNRLPENP